MINTTEVKKIIIFTIKSYCYCDDDVYEFFCFVYLNYHS